MINKNKKNKNFKLPLIPNSPKIKKVTKNIDNNRINKSIELEKIDYFQIKTNLNNKIKSNLKSTKYKYNNFLENKSTDLKKIFKKITLIKKNKQSSPFKSLFNNKKEENLKIELTELNFKLIANKKNIKNKMKFFKDK